MQCNLQYLGNGWAFFEQNSPGLEIVACLVTTNPNKLPSVILLIGLGKNYASL